MLDLKLSVVSIAAVAVLLIAVACTNDSWHTCPVAVANVEQPKSRSEVFVIDWHERSKQRYDLYRVAIAVHAKSPDVRISAVLFASQPGTQVAGIWAPPGSAITTTRLQDFLFGRDAPEPTKRNDLALALKTAAAAGPGTSIWLISDADWSEEAHALIKNAAAECRARECSVNVVLDFAQTIRSRDLLWSVATSGGGMTLDELGQLVMPPLQLPSHPGSREDDRDIFKRWPAKP
jgi:hypothetical protein